MSGKVQMGTNRTGIDLSPVQSQEMIEGVDRYCTHETRESLDVPTNRIRFAREWDGLGSLPLPGTLKGVAATGMQKLTGKRPEVLIDKLGERAAFERTGTRLYDALISRYQASEDTKSLPPLTELQRIRDEEHRHFQLVSDVIRDIGADPTAVTPAADAAGVASMGVVQLIADPRSTFAQCLEGILIAELADRDGWGMLIRLAEEAGLKEASERFREALRAEEDHLRNVRRWLQRLTLGEAGATPEEQVA